jgi:hypothetical protein
MITRIFMRHQVYKILVTFWLRTLQPPLSPQVIRVAFNEITREAVLHALAHPRSVSTPLVEAYLARRALDYVMGYGLSPVLWRKLPGSKSAGRVQSVALRLVTDREHAIRTFQQREYWSVDAACQGPHGDAFQAALTHVDGQRLGQFGIVTAEEAQRAAGRVAGASLEVAEVKRTKVRKGGGAQEGGRRPATALWWAFPLRLGCADGCRFGFLRIKARGAVCKGRAGKAPSIFSLSSNCRSFVSGRRQLAASTKCESSTSLVFDPRALLLQLLLHLSEDSSFQNRIVTAAETTKC